MNSTPQQKRSQTAPNSSEKLMNRLYSAIESRSVVSNSPSKESNLHVISSQIHQITMLERQIVDFELKLASLQTELDQKALDTQKLQSDRMFLFNREREASERNRELQNELSSLKESFGRENMDLNRELTRLQDELSMVKLEMADESSRFDREFMEVCNERDAFRLEAEEARREADRLKMQIAKQPQVQQEPQRHESIKSAQNEELALISKQYREQEIKMSKLLVKNGRLEETVSHLKLIQENTEKLNEEKKTLEKQVSLYQKIVKDLESDRVLLQKLKDEKQQWMAFIEDQGESIGFNSPFEMARSISQQKLEIASLKSEQSHSRAIQAEKAKEIAELEEQIKTFQSKMSEWNETTRQWQKKCRTLENEKNLAEKKCKLLKDQLVSALIKDSYDMEETSVTGSLDEHKRKRIELLSGSVTELESKLAALEKENELLKAGKGQLSASQARIGQLERKIKLYELNGSYDSESTRVLMLADNPESKAESARKELMEALKSENEELRSQFSKSSGIPAQSYQLLQNELQDLKQQLETKETRIDRLKQVFGQKVQEYLEAVAEILGYRLDLGEDGLVRIFSVYAGLSDPGLVYCFKGANRGQVELTGGNSDTVEKIKTIIMPWMDGGSLPCLLSCLTIGLFTNTHQRK